MKIRILTVDAMLTAVSMCVYAIESAIPPLVSFPGVKLGLANAVTLAAIYISGRRDAFVIVAVRLILTFLLFGNMMSFLFSATAGLACCAVMSICSYFTDKEDMWITSIFGALVHNGVQILIASFIVGTVGLLYYFFVLVIASVLSGLFTGICAKYTVMLFDKLKI